MRTHTFASICAMALLAGCARSPDSDAGSEPAAHAESTPAPETSAAVPLQPDSAVLPGTPLMPADERALDATLQAFLGRMTAAVAARDTAALMALIDPGIKFSFGDDHGSAGFRRAWFREHAHEDLWLELGNVLSLGGTFANDSQFVAPWTFSTWPRDVDPFEHWAVVDSGSVVREAPAADAAILGTLGWRIVRLPQGGPLGHAPAWTLIDRGSERLGYAEMRAFRSPINYRAFFERHAGRWEMTLFVAGD